jgi:hypothetical protein
MIALAEADYIALTGEADGRLFAVLWPEGRALIERHRFEQAKGDHAATQAWIAREIRDYRLDPKNPRQLTPDEARRLPETPIDYSNIPPFGDEFFSQAKAGRMEPRPIEARRALVRQIAQPVLDPCKAHGRDQVDEAQTLAALKAWLSDFARHTSEIRDRAKHELG